nr:hypothetical protein [Tanacetum cinerariifolium]
VRILQISQENSQNWTETDMRTERPQVTSPVPAGKLYRRFPVPTDRGYSPSVMSGWWSQTPSPIPYFTDPASSYFQTYTPYLPTMYYNNMQYSRDSWATAVKPSVDTECLVLSKDLKPPDDSMVVLKAIHAESSISKPLQLLHMDLFGPTSIRSIDHKYYCLVITDDYSRFCWVFFMEHKDETYSTLKSFIILVENQMNNKNPTENRVAERKNRTLIEIARTMLAVSKLPTIFWTEAVRTTCYVLNRVSVTNPHNKTPYALLTGKIPFVSHFKPFGCHVTILNTSDHLGKFDGKADEGYIVGYSASNKAYRVYSVPNKRVEETMNLHFLEDKPNLTNLQAHKETQLLLQGTQSIDIPDDKVDDSPFSTPAGVEAILSGCILVPTGIVPVPTSSVPVPAGSLPVATSSVTVPTDDTMVPTDDVPVHTGNTTDSMFDGEPITRFLYPSDLGNHNPLPGIFSFSSYDDEFDTALNNVDFSVQVSLVPTKRIHTIHPQSLIIGDPTSVLQTRSMVKQNTTAQALTDPSWVDDMQEEMQQFKFHNVWVLVELPPGKYAIGTKWILKNKRDARGIVVSNKARLVAQGHRQEEGIDYDEVFTPIPRIEAIRLFLAFASYMGFLVYQIDVNSAFLYGRIKEEVYVTQPKGFIDPQHRTKVYKVVKALYGLHQAPRAWYATISTFLLKHGYKRGSINKTLFLMKNNRDIIMVQVYVDDIVFGSTKKEWCAEFEALMKREFQMSAMGELTFFLEAVKKIFKYLKGQPKLGLWYPKESPFVLEAYSDSDYAGANKDKKFTTGGCLFLGRRLISWYALTTNPVIFDSLVKQFWSTATLRAPELGPLAILATIDRTPYTITEDLIRSTL